MKENKYDDEYFFEKYGQMDRSQKGLEGAGEWHALKTPLPSFEGKRVLDLGCGFGWHCIYAAKQRVASVIGVDISEKMIEEHVPKRMSITSDIFACRLRITIILRIPSTL